MKKKRRNHANLRNFNAHVWAVVVAQQNDIGENVVRINLKNPKYVGYRVRYPMMGNNLGEMISKWTWLVPERESVNVDIGTHYDKSSEQYRSELERFEYFTKPAKDDRKK